MVADLRLVYFYLLLLWIFFFFGIRTFIKIYQIILSIIINILTLGIIMIFIYVSREHIIHVCHTFYMELLY